MISVEYKQDDDYDRAAQEALEKLQRWVALYFAGGVALVILRERMENIIRDHHLRMMFLAVGVDAVITLAQLRWLERRVNRDLEYLRGFLGDIAAGRMTEQRALWRAGLYAFPRGTYVGFTIPFDVVSLMPVLPGDDCLGGSNCHCWLSVDYDDDGTAYVYWHNDPTSKSCAVCIAHAIDSPFVFTAEELRGVL